MAEKKQDVAPKGRIEREIARERHERSLHDEARARLATPEDFHTKDARESADSSNVKRHPGR
ncbi:hypothetical protein [Massilia niastensis]|uniref:hypothetical protein n=1 Tax=Massilia niastensis TaxID=544911 RepID=UPI00036E8674|nr:hypothetical protein [Massilia niastensis]